MTPVSGLTTVNRLVTGHNSQGKAVFDHEEQLTPLTPFAANKSTSAASAAPLGITLIHRTRGFPVQIQGSVEELSADNLRRGQGPSGIVCQVVDLPPTLPGQAVYMHRNQSLDYGVVLRGTMQIILDDGEEKTLGEGDIYVQKGTNHAWKNITSEYCRFLTVVIPSEEVVVGDTGEHLEVTKIPGLSD